MLNSTFLLLELNSRFTFYNQGLFHNQGLLRNQDLLRNLSLLRIQVHNHLHILHNHRHILHSHLRNPRRARHY